MKFADRTTCPKCFRAIGKRCIKITARERGVIAFTTVPHPERYQRALREFAKER